MSDTYQVGGSLRQNSPSYVVRQADLDLVMALNNGELSYVLNARQMGKSSLRVRTMHQLQQQGRKCGAVDLTLLGTRTTTPEQWYASFAASLIQSFRLEVQLGSWWRNHQELSLVRRLATFFEEILLPQVPGPIVLFIDEVDSVMALTFPTDDFFALIRATYDRRSEMPEYRRLTWALFGVATPAALIRDPQRTPLNIGRAIQLRGFQDHEVFPLACGLVGKVNQPMAVLKAILYWTAGQPFLTQKLCQLTMQSSQSTIQGTLNLPPGTESFWVEQLVHKHILQDWEAQDYPEHLRTIRDRLLFEPRGRRDRLLLYRQLLLREQSNPVPDEPEEVSPKNQNSPSRPLADLSLDSTRGISPAPATQFVNSPTPPAEQLRLGTDWLGKSLEKSLDFEQVIFSSDRAIEPVLTELLLSGLVEQRQGRLQVKNPIYQAIFNLNWVDAQLATYDALELQSSTAPAQPSESPARSPMDQSSVARLSAAQVEPPPIALSDAIVSSTINPISDPSLESASLDRTAEVGSNAIVDQSKSSVDLATPTVAVPLHPSSGSSLQQVEPALAQPIDSEDSTLAVPNPPSQIADRKDKLVSQSVLDAVPEEVKQMAQQHLQTQLLQEIQQLKQQRSWLVGCILFLLTIVVYQLLFR